jgi:chromosome segregation ATPase
MGMAEIEKNEDLQKSLDEFKAILKSKEEKLQAQIDSSIEQLRSELLTISGTYIDSVTEIPEYKVFLENLQGAIKESGALEDGDSASSKALVKAQERIEEIDQLDQKVPDANLKRYIKELEQNLEKRNDTINVARRRILRLQEKIENIASEKAVASQKVADFEIQLDRKNLAFQQSEKRFSELRRKFELKMGVTEATNAQKQALEEQLEEKNKLLQFHENRAQEALDQVGTNAGDLARLNEKIEVLSLELKEQQNLFQKTEIANRELQNQVHRLEEEQSAAGQAEWTSANAALETQIKAFETEISEHLDKAEGMSAQITAAEKAAADERTKREEAEQKIKILMEEAQERHQETASLAAELESFKVQIGQLNSIGEKSSLLEEQTGALQQELAQQKEALTAVQTEKEAIEKRLEEENLRLEEMSKQFEEKLREKEEKENVALRTLQEEVAQKSADLEDLQSKLTRTEEERSQVTLAQETLLKEKEEARLAGEKQQAEHEQSLAQINTLTEKVAQLEKTLADSLSPEELAELEQKVVEERKRADMLQEMYDHEIANGTKANLARQYADVLDELEKAREELRRYRSTSQGDA